MTLFRRSVAGSIGSGGSDGGIIKQLGMYVRTKSDSGKKLTDQEILQQIKVYLTAERCPLKILQQINCRNQEISDNVRFTMIPFKSPYDQ